MTGFLERKIRGKILHVATGGFAHFIGLLEGSFEKASSFPRHRLSVFTEHHKPLGFLKFGEIFEIVSVWRTPLIEPGMWPTNLPRVERILEARTPRTWALATREACHQFTWLDCGLASFCCGTTECDEHVTGGRLLAPPARFRKILRTIRLTPGLALEVQSLLPDMFDSYIGVHYRDTDRSSDFKATIANLDAAISKHRPKFVYWSSDNSSSFGWIRAAFPGVSFIEVEKPSPLSMENLHFGVSDSDAKRQLLTALADLYCLSRSNWFIPSSGRTGWTGLIKKLRERNVYQKFFGAIR